MRQNERQLRELFAKFKKFLQEESEADIDGDSDFYSEETSSDNFIACTPKFLPTRLLVTAAKTAVKVNPVNAISAGPVAAAGISHAVDEPLRIAVLVQKYWGPTERTLTVSFLDGGTNEFKNKVLKHLNAWSKTCGITFRLVDRGGQVRISTGSGGYYSYLGTDILHIPAHRQTMNLQDFTARTSDAEYKRVVQHEAGHTLGFPHEHMREALVRRIDRQKAFAYFRRTSGWDQATVIAQVLTPLSAASIVGTPVDQDSIMCYQLPGEITIDGNPIRGGKEINATDAEFARRIYPKASRTPDFAAAIGYAASDRDEGDWAESEDVTDPDLS